jgi:hypothetical protein
MFSCALFYSFDSPCKSSGCYVTPSHHVNIQTAEVRLGSKQKMKSEILVK